MPYKLFALGKSFFYAFRGFSKSIKSERNLRIHLLATIVVIVAGYFFRIESWAWVATFLCIGFVISLELINTALERLCDKIVGENQDKIIEDVKDIAAAAVLVAVIISVIISIIIFGQAIQNSGLFGRL